MQSENYTIRDGIGDVNKHSLQLTLIVNKIAVERSEIRFRSIIKENLTFKS